ncbi:hypothetical protein PPHE_a0814 [Pseudoalteromonas phenolica O-BC30]|nr:hypothetical protein [Pseudoalteromonas phenolica O-BC30]
MFNLKLTKNHFFKMTFEDELSIKNLNKLKAYTFNINVY